MNPHPDAPPLDYVYDEESYPNVYTNTIIHPLTGAEFVYEVSDRCNDFPALYHFVTAAGQHRCRMFGFNNFFYDYPVLHHMLEVYERNGFVTAWNAYEKTDQLINRTPFNDRYKNVIWDRQQRVIQGDLYLIHHFDNRAKGTSLKQLEFNMRAPNIGDLPFKPGSYLTPDEIDVLLHYNGHDTRETTAFYIHSLPQIRDRDETARDTGMDCLNYNDTKIGKKFFRMELEKAGVPMGKDARTPRQFIDLHTVIFPTVKFESEAFNGILRHLWQTRLTDTNKPPELDNLNVTFEGFTYQFGAGGIHGSVERQVVRPAPGWRLLDIDVASYYPNLAIANRVFPEHLSTVFCDVNLKLFEWRKTVPKSKPLNGTLKLAMNGVYGDSNNVHSEGFYDPKYTMTITINGQLLLTMLAERLVLHCGCQVVQINTDGMTVLLPDTHAEQYAAALTWWQDLTALKLEEVEYGSMFIRDVNSYISTLPDGTVKKRKGAYQWKTDKPTNLNESLVWHQDWSALVVPMAAEAQMVRGIPVREFIYNHNDPFDFMLKSKAPGEGRAITRYEDGTERVEQKVTRYHVATTGPKLYNVYKPLAKAPEKERYIAVHSDRAVQICNDVRDFDGSRLDYDYYIREAGKLLI